MIGNVICAIDNAQLNNLIEIRKNFKYNYIRELNEKTGQNFSIPKCKVIVIDDLVINQDPPNNRTYDPSTNLGTWTSFSSVDSFLNNFNHNF